MVLPPLAELFSATWPTGVSGCVGNSVLQLRWLMPWRGPSNSFTLYSPARLQGLRSKFACLLSYFNLH